MACPVTSFSPIAQADRPGDHWRRAVSYGAARSASRHAGCRVKAILCTRASSPGPSRAYVVGWESRSQLPAAPAAPVNRAATFSPPASFHGLPAASGGEPTTSRPAWRSQRLERLLAERAGPEEIPPSSGPEMIRAAGNGSGSLVQAWKLRRASSRACRCKVFGGDRLDDQQRERRRGATCQRASGVPKVVSGYSTEASQRH